MAIILTALGSVGAAKPSSNIRRDYKTLGISQSSDMGEIKQVYRKLSLEYHPDRNPGCSDCTIKQAELNSAYERILYARREHDHPELRDFFGFSEKVYNLVHDITDLWENIPTETKERFFHLLKEYGESPAVGQDIEHLMGLLFKFVGNFFTGPVATVIFYVIVFMWLCFFIGYCWVLVRIYRIVKKVLGFVFSGLSSPFRLLFGSSSKDKDNCKEKKA
ncbi:hypothetical protein TL16_g03386 [Triparma laevis f. inornata]|uniref:J domain-containing protein n=1 Tax=Triparma laevis f. inornata TaxID=1714386 RepID=A0A9W7A1W8_9STRA|nr:hypothetical protein TL16_g03386 [Triparma laevis f. inornata]